MYVDTSSTPDNWHPPLIALIGMGMGKGDLSLASLGWIERAEVLFGGSRHLECFTDHPAEKVAINARIEDVLADLDRISRERRTVVLASGDPLFYGIGRRLVQHLGKDRIIILPNITTVQALFGRIGESWADIKVISLHGRKGEAERRNWMRELRRHPVIAIYTDMHHTPDRIAREMLDAGVTDRFLVVGENLGLPSEAVGRFSLEEAAARTFSPLNLVAVLTKDSADAEPAPHGPVLGLPENAFEHEAGMITKMEVRAVALAQLQLEPDLVMWDLGAGSGSVSIEAARFARLGQVFAVEKDFARFQDLLNNVRRFQCYEIRAVHGKAAEVIRGFPDPDRVFIGGSGADLVEMLREAAARLRPGGRIVQTAVTLDTLETARSFWRGKPFDVSIIQVQVNRSVPIGNTLRFDALNPVYIITSLRGSAEGIP